MFKVSWELFGLPGDLCVNCFCCLLCLVVLICVWLLHLDLLDLFNLVLRLLSVICVEFGRFSFILLRYRLCAEVGFGLDTRFCAFGLIGVLVSWSFDLFLVVCCLLILLLVGCDWRL